MSKIPVFDIGDTLIPVTANINDAVNSVLKEEEIEDPPYFPIDQFNIYKVERIQAWLDKHEIDADPEKIHKAYIEWKKDYFKKSGTFELLRKLNEDFGPIGIITNNCEGAKECYKEIIESHGVKVEGFVASADVGVKKPDSRIFEAFLGKREESADRFVYFGNFLKKDIGAEEVGMDFVLVTEYKNYGSTDYRPKIDNLSYESVRKEL
ncbi:MAG: HAD family hydrolase [Candidatus Nanohaloarchaea archaeon]